MLRLRISRVMLSGASEDEAPAADVEPVLSTVEAPRKITRDDTAGRVEGARSTQCDTAGRLEASLNL